MTEFEHPISKRATYVAARGLTLLLCALLASSPVFAAETAPLAQSLKGEGKAEYEAGRILYGDGDYAGATLKFQRAYEVSKDPRLLWNMAAAQKNLRHYAEVERLIKRYQAESGDSMSRSDKQEAASLLEAIASFIADVTVSVNEKGAVIRVDGKRVGTSPLDSPLRLDIGERKIDVEKKGFAPFSTSLRIVGREHRVDVKLKPEAKQGRLKILADPGDAIRVDGERVATGKYEGSLAVGSHEIEVTAQGKKLYRTDATVRKNETTSLRIILELEPSATQDTGGSNLTWLWITGGVLLAAGAGVGTYFLVTKDSEAAPPPVDGSLGTVELPFSF